MTLTDLRTLYPDLEQYVDIIDGMNRIRKNKKIYRLILGEFLKDTHFEELKTQIESDDLDSAAKTAHLIKGVTANLSLRYTNNLVKEIEGLLKDKNPAASDLVAPLGTAIEKTVLYIGYVLDNLEDIDF